MTEVAWEVISLRASLQNLQEFVQNYHLSLLPPILQGDLIEQPHVCINHASFRPVRKATHNIWGTERECASSLPKGL